VHQFARIGSQVIVGGLSGARGDIIPFGLASGQHAMLEGLNVIGMKRRKFTRERLATVRAFYKKLSRRGRFRGCCCCPSARPAGASGRFWA
jgi:UDP-N-acetylglucosamine acyltransferase